MSNKVLEIFFGICAVVGFVQIMGFFLGTDFGLRIIAIGIFLFIGLIVYIFYDMSKDYEHKED